MKAVTDFDILSVFPDADFGDAYSITSMGES
jgi:hypothetical protein